MTHTSELHPHLIHAYSRQQALVDGVLIDADSLEQGFAAQAGFAVPVALTQGAWADVVAWSEAVESAKARPTAQDERGRLWDVLTMARFSARRAGTASRIEFRVLRIPPTDTRTRSVLADLAMVIGPGDRGEAVVTIMRTDED